MGGVDRADQRRSTYTVSRKSMRWWKALYFWMIDVAGVIFFICMADLATKAGEEKITQLQFRKRLIEDLLTHYGTDCGPSVTISGSTQHRRSASSCGVSMAVLKSGRRYPERSERRRCRVCYDQARGTDGGKKPIISARRAVKLVLVTCIYAPNVLKCSMSTQSNM